MDKIEKVFFTTQDPEKLLNGQPVPAMTSLLYGVCGNDPAKFEEACRIIRLFIVKAMETSDGKEAELSA